MKRLLKISHKDHSGKLRSHEHTSYIPLFFVLFLVGAALAVYTAATARPGPAAGSIGMSGVMPGEPPDSAATIDVPSGGQSFSDTPVSVSGRCPAGTLVQLFKNDIFAGSTPCLSDGTYSTEIDLLFGPNELVARVYDDLNQAGPDSNIVAVTYNFLPPQAGPTSLIDFGSNQLVINTDAVFRGTFPDEELTIPIDIIGGVAPYAINIQWGDNNNKVIPRPDNNSFRATHTYQQAGVFPITIQATDAEGRVAFLTVAAIVNGQPPIAATTVTDNDMLNRLLMLWPIYTTLVAVVISFWLGERREKYLLSKRGLLLTNS